FLLRSSPLSTLFPYTTLFRSTVDLRIDYLRPVPGVDLYVTARTLKVGYSIARVDVEIRGAQTACLAVGRGTFSTQVSRSQEVARSEEHTSELQSRENLVCRLL